MDFLKSIDWRLVRRWVYGVLIAFGALAIYQGWLEPEALPLYAGIVLAVFNTRPPKTPDEAS